MGLLDQLLSLASSGASPSTGQPDVHPGLLNHVMGMIGNSQSGGLTGMVERLQAGGIGPAVASWIGGGPNQPVSADQIHSAFGAEQISQIAQKFGLSNDQVSAQLSKILPEVINHLTPDNNMPHQSMVDQALGALKGKLLGG